VSLSVSQFWALAGAALLCMGLHGVFVRPHLLRKILALNVAGSGTFLILIATAYRGFDAPPDPVPHALVLTGIVVAVSMTAAALVLAALVKAATGRADLPPDGEDGP
jgi:multicomponent Na+:H+ antiporter subunit C